MLIIVNTNKKSFYYRGRIIYYSKKEFMLFYILIRSVNGQNLGKQEIIDYIWRERAAGVSANNISQLTYRVRKKIKNGNIPLDIIFSANDGFKVKPANKIRCIHINNFLFSFLEMRCLKATGT